MDGVLQQQRATVIMEYVFTLLGISTMDLCMFRSAPYNCKLTPVTVLRHVGTGGVYLAHVVGNLARGWYTPYNALLAVRAGQQLVPS